jgi:endonuclease III
MHTKRVLPRLGLKPQDLWEPAVEEESRAHLSCAITYLGRKYCRPKKPRCNVCPVKPHCPTGEKS